MVFIANGYSRQQIKNAMTKEKRTKRTNVEERDEDEIRGTVVIPYIENLSQALQENINSRDRKSVV